MPPICHLGQILLTLGMVIAIQADHECQKVADLRIHVTHATHATSVTVVMLATPVGPTADRSHRMKTMIDLQEEASVQMRQSQVAMIDPAMFEKLKAHDDMRGHGTWIANAGQAEIDPQDLRRGKGMPTKEL